MSYMPVRANQDIGYDAGGRTRASTLTTLFDGKTLGADDSTIWENVGTGTATYSNNKVNMAVTSGQYIVRRSKRYFPYFSGKSQLIECTFDNFQIEANVTKRVGYFSSNAVAPYDTSLDGFSLFNDGTTVRLQAHRFGTLTADVPFVNWDNYAALSSYDWSKFTVVVFDYLWLGGTELRVFVKTNTGFVLAHTFKWASGNTDTFIGSPNHCIRYSVRSTTGSGSIRCICSAVATEGDIAQNVKGLGLFNATAITTNTVGVIYALKGVKKLAAFRDTAIAIESVGTINTTGTDQGLIMLIANPTISAPLTYVTNGKISEGTATNQTITTGTGRVIYAEPAGTSGSASGLSNDYLAYIGMSIADVSEELVLAYMPVTANQSVHGVINVKEF